jgi:histidyl-tRNA synthetase
MVAQRQRQLIYPLRWWSFGPFWRYERPQKGRTREFFQWNVDLLGIESPEADAELIALVATFFKQVGLSPDEVTILVNSRQLTNSELTHIGIPQSIKIDVFNLIDRRKKMKLKAWEENALQIGVSESQLDAIKSMLEDKSLWEKSSDLCRAFESLEAMGVADYIQYDPGIIRGLLYYTGIVFEAFDRIGYISRSILGGGRYDNLLSDVGGDPLPASGFAMGDLIITLLLQKLGHIPDSINQPTAQVMVTVFNNDTMMKAQALASELREAGFNTTCYPEEEKLGKQFKFADRMGIQVVLILGPDEIGENTVAVKNMTDGSQLTIPHDQLIPYLADLVPSR